MNDPLDDLFNNIGNEVRTSSVAYKSAEQRFEEGCPKCGGSGRFTSYTGRVLGECFACKGAGKKVFKTSAPAREKAREQAAARKADRVAADLQAFEAAHPAVMAWLKAETAKSQPFAFAVSMVEAIVKFGSLTDNQLAACERLVAKAAARTAERAAQQAARAADAPAVDVARIEQAFATAIAKARRPGQQGVMVKPLRLTSSAATGALSVKVRPGSEGSQWEGMLFVKTLDDRKLGHVKGGRFHARRECTPAEAAAVVEVCGDPQAAVLAYAKAFSSCGICGRGLLNDVSIARGIGPICAEKFGFVFACEEA